MSDYCGVNPSHVLLLPREDILVLFQEVNKEVSEVFYYVGTDVGEVFRVISSNCTGSSSSEGSGQVFTLSHMSSSSTYILSTGFCFIDAV